jgi:hypothetical protein
MLSLCIVSACGGGPTPTPDTRATIDAAVAATNDAGADIQATIDAAVLATTEALPSPTPAPAPAVDYSTMGEAVLAEEIDQAVDSATTATEEGSNAAADANADGVWTQEEADEVELLLAEAEQAITYADEMIDVYYDLYGELAAESLLLLQDLDEDLALLEEALIGLSELFWEVEGALEQGLDLAEETLAQIGAAATAAWSRAMVVQELSQGWAQALASEMQNRATNVLAVQPSSIASTRVDALRAAFEYVDVVRQALADNSISAGELANIAQLGANASAGLSASGGPQLEQLAGAVDSITSQIAQGQTMLAQATLSSLEISLGPRPTR